MITLEVLKRITDEEFDRACPPTLGEIFTQGDEGPPEYPDWFWGMVRTHLEAETLPICPQVRFATLTLSSLIIGWNLCEQYYRVGSVEGEEANEDAG